MKRRFCVCLATCNSCRLCTAPYVSLASLFACAVYVASQNEIPSSQLASNMIPQERRHLQVCTPKSHDLHFHFFRGKKWSWLFFCRKGSISLFNSPPKKRKAKDDFLWQTHLQGFRRFFFGLPHGPKSTSASLFEGRRTRTTWPRGALMQHKDTTRSEMTWESRQMKLG